MKYCDLHCDVLTASGQVQVTGERLRAGECTLVVCAAFVKTGGYARFCHLADLFPDWCRREGVWPVTRAGELGAGVNALLSSEGGSFSTLAEVDGLYARGVRMAGFVWNTPTPAGYPNFPDYAGKISPVRRERGRGLTPFGFAAAERMRELGILMDVSHGSDRLFADVASLGVPFVASHSNAASVRPWTRNLTDAQIGQVADSGGVVGLNLCADFLSGDGSAAGQRAAVMRHVRAMVNAGGEEVLAIGSDFDGIPPNAFVPDPSHMPKLLSVIADAVGERAAEKCARDNVLRVLRAVCP